MDTNIYVLRLKKSLELKNVTDNTTKSYISYLKCFLRFLDDKKPEDVSFDEVADFILYLTKIFRPEY